jgi:hypothetical protein
LADDFTVLFCCLLSIAHLVFMLVINDKIIADAVLYEQFVCNLSSCKGDCCVQGDAGAPLEEQELGILDDIYPHVEPYLMPQGIAAIAEQGKYVQDEEGIFSTPLIEGAACAYVRFDDLGIAQCAIQQAHRDGKIDFPKPISCHLYPIRTKKQGYFEAVNYDRWDICKAACKLGKQLRVPVYVFLKEPLIRKYGEDFYAQLDAAAHDLKKR